MRGDQIATQVFHLKFESATNLVAVLRPLISPNNTINANPGNNTLVITDYADNLLRLGKDNRCTGRAREHRYGCGADPLCGRQRYCSDGKSAAGDWRNTRRRCRAHQCAGISAHQFCRGARAVRGTRQSGESADRKTRPAYRAAGQCARGLPEECRSDQACTNLARSRVIGYFCDHFGNTYPHRLHHHHRPLLRRYRCRAAAQPDSFRPIQPPIR